MSGLFVRSLERQEYLGTGGAGRLLDLAQRGCHRFRWIKSPATQLLNRGNFSRDNPQSRGSEMRLGVVAEQVKLPLGCLDLLLECQDKSWLLSFWSSFLLNASWDTADDVSSAWVSANHVRDPHRVPGHWLWPSPGYCRDLGSKPEDARALSLFLCHSAFQTNL